MLAFAQTVTSWAMLVIYDRNQLKIYKNSAQILKILNCSRWKSFAVAVFIDQPVTQNFSSELVILPLCNTQDYHATEIVF